MTEFNYQEAIISYLIPMGNGFKKKLAPLTDYRDRLLTKHPEFREDIISEYTDVVRSAISDHVTKAINAPIDEVLPVVEELNLSTYLEDDLL